MAATIIRMWSGPRNLSTAMMRSWGNRADTAVLDEPLYAHFLAESGLDHPGAASVIAAGPTRWHEAVDRCADPALGPGQSISYQKHMAHHLLPGCDRSWIGDAKNVLLLRHPRRVIASYVRLREQPTLDDLGFPQLMALQEQFGPLPVVEADQFLDDPERGLRRLCAELNVSFDPAMLQWAPGTRPTDGVWASHWYASVESSTGFTTAPADDPADIALPEAMQRLAAEAQPLYEALSR